MHSDRLKSPSLPQEFYPNDLLVIKNIKFTPRQIDIIACLISGGTGKTISSLLSIEVKTLETHKKSIGERIGGGIQEDIIAFVQRSDKYEYIKKHYLNLLYKDEFEKQLKELAKNNHENLPILRIESQQISNKSSLFNLLISHIKLAGLRILDYKEAPPVTSDSLLYTLSFVTKNTTIQLKENKNSPLKIFLILDKEIEENTLRELFESEALCIDFRDYKKYFSAYMEILKRIYTNADLEKLSSMVNIENNYNFKNLEKHYDYNITKQIVPSPILGFLQKKKRCFFIGSFTLLSIVAAYSLDFNIKNIETLSYYQRDQAVRIDLPIPKQSAFLHRPMLITKIDKALKNQKGIGTVALAGIGGAGKTTLARYYTYTHPSSIVWEVNAETNNSIITSFENFAHSLAKTQEERKILRSFQTIKNPYERGYHFLSFVKTHLKKEHGWLIIYDNVESFKSLQNYFPHDVRVWGEGKVIVTTRDKNIQNNNSINCVVYVDELTLSEKEKLFFSIIEINPDNNEIKKIKSFLSRIPPFPLDISLAAYYLKATNISYDQYLENFKYNYQEFSDLQKDILKDATEYSKTRDEIINLSLKKLIESHKDFADLLFLVSILNSQNIPRNLMSLYKNPAIVDKLIYHLKKYSLITTRGLNENNFDNMIFIHRSTQQSMFAYLKSIFSFEISRNKIASIVPILKDYIEKLTEKEEFRTWIQLKNHLETLLTHNEYITDTTRAELESELGKVNFLSGNYKKAKSYFENSNTILNGNKLKKNTLYAQNLAYLGNIHRELGNYTVAVDYLKKSLVIYKLNNANNKEPIAKTLAYLGNAMRNLGQVNQAKVLIQESLDIYIKNFPSRHGAIARILGFLGHINWIQGNFLLSKELFKKSLHVYNSYCPENEVGIARILVLLAQTCVKLGEYDEAERRVLQGLDIYNRLYMKNHIDIAWASVHLGNIFVYQGKHKNAKILLENVLAIYRSHYPEGHIDIAWVSNFLSSAYYNLGEYDKALKLLETSLPIYQLTFGRQHIDNASVLTKLANLYHKIGDLDKAIKLLNDALVIYQKYGHSDEYQCLECLADIYITQSYKAKAIYNKQLLSQKSINLLRQALQIVTKKFTKNSIHKIRITSKLKNIELTFLT